MSRLSITFLGVALAAVVGLTLLQTQISAASPDMHGSTEQSHDQANGHGPGHGSN